MRRQTEFYPVDKSTYSIHSHIELTGLDIQQPQRKSVFLVIVSAITCRSMNDGTFLTGSMPMRIFKILFLFLPSLAFSNDHLLPYDVWPNVSFLKSFSTHIAGFMCGMGVSYGTEYALRSLCSPRLTSLGVIAAVGYSAKSAYQSVHSLTEKEPSEEYRYRLAASILQGGWCSYLMINDGNLIPRIN